MAFQQEDTLEEEFSNENLIVGHSPDISPQRPSRMSQVQYSRKMVLLLPIYMSSWRIKETVTTQYYTGEVRRLQTNLQEPRQSPVLQENVTLVPAPGLSGRAPWCPGAQVTPVEEHSGPPHPQGTGSRTPVDTMSAVAQVSSIKCTGCARACGL